MGPLEEAGEVVALFPVAVIVIGADQYGGAVVDIAVVVEVGQVAEAVALADLEAEVLEAADQVVVGRLIKVSYRIERNKEE